MGMRWEARQSARAAFRPHLPYSSHRHRRLPCPGARTRLVSPLSVGTLLAAAGGNTGTASTAVHALEEFEMESRAKLVGHAIHPMLIVFPLGLLGMAAIFDLIFAVAGARDLALASYWMIAAGIVTGLLAAVFGLWDWLAI